MNRRPLSIMIISWLFIAIGVVALTYHSIHLSEDNIIWILFVRLLAIVCGVAMLFRQNWAPWLTAARLAYHVYLSLYHRAFELLVHALLFGISVYFLFRSSNSYFRGTSSPS